MPAPPSEQDISAEELRHLFNEGLYWERAQSGEFYEVIQYNEPAPAKLGKPPGTRSQVVHYFDAQDRKVAVVHQFTRRDGTILSEIDV